MENYPSSNNNNNHHHQQVLDPMPLKACPPSSNVESMAFIPSVTPLRNKRMYDPKMSRLTEVKRLARNRRKSYPKYVPYPCQWCPRILPTSQSFAGHMRAHYRRIQTAARKAAKQAQQRLQQQRNQRPQQQSYEQHQRRQRQRLTPEQRLAKELIKAQTRTEAKLVKARARAEKLARNLARINAKLGAHNTAPAPEPEPVPAPVPAEAPAPDPVPLPTPTPPASVASGSGKQPLRINDVHLRQSNSQFGQTISPGNKDTSVSTESASNAKDSCIYTKRRPITSPNSTTPVIHYHHFLQVPPGLASSYRPHIDVNKKPAVEQIAFPDHEDLKPPPGFHNQLLSSEGPQGRKFNIKEEIIVIDDDDEEEVVAYGSWDDLALRL